MIAALAGMALCAIIITGCGLFAREVYQADHIEHPIGMWIELLCITGWTLIALAFMIALGVTA